MTDLSPDRQMKLLNTALDRIGCTLPQAFLCHVLFQAQMESSDFEQAAKPAAFTLKELASRPRRLCCSVGEASALLNQVQHLGLVKQLGYPPGSKVGGDPNARIELQLDWAGIKAIVETSVLA